MLTDLKLMLVGSEDIPDATFDPSGAVFAGHIYSTFTAYDDVSVQAIALSGSNLYIGGCFATYQENILGSYGVLDSTTGASLY